MSQVENTASKLKNKKSFLWNSKKTDSTQTPNLKKKKSTASALLSAPVGTLRKKSSGFFTTVLGKINSRFSKSTIKQQDVNKIEPKAQPRFRSTNNLRYSTDTSLRSKPSSINSGYHPITSFNITNTHDINEWSSTLLNALDATQNKVNSETDAKVSSHIFINTACVAQPQTLSSNNRDENEQNKCTPTRKRFISSTSSRRKSDYQMSSWRQNFNNISDLTLDGGLYQRSSIQQDSFSIMSEYNHPSMTEATPRSTSEFNQDLFSKKDSFEDSKIQSYENNKSLLSALQINNSNQNVADMTVQEKLEIAAARRNLIKYHRQREQMDTALLETLEMLSNGQYRETPSTSKQDQTDIKVRDWIINCQQKDSEISVNNLDVTTSQDSLVW